MEVKGTEIDTERTTWVSLAIIWLGKAAITLIRRRKIEKEAAAAKEIAESKSTPPVVNQQQEVFDHQKQIITFLRNQTNRETTLRIRAEGLLTECQKERSEMRARTRAWQMVVTRIIRELRQEIAELKNVPYQEDEELTKLFEEVFEEDE